MHACSAPDESDFTYAYAPFRSYSSMDEARQVISDEMLKPLGDQYTRFITPAKYEALRSSIVSGGKGQEISGVGITLSIDKVHDPSCIFVSFFSRVFWSMYTAT
jgi:hypothetical protein